MRNPAHINSLSSLFYIFTGKEAITIFERVSINKEEDYSIVSCQPVTGVTHQIRAHLQYLGTTTVT